jgi:hypothetical protein
MAHNWDTLWFVSQLRSPGIAKKGQSIKGVAGNQGGCWKKNKTVH